MDLEAMLRPHLRQLVPYVCARHEHETAPVRLDANENPWGRPLQPALNRYPDPLQREMVTALARQRGVDPARIFVGNGSDECIDLLIRLFCRPGIDQVMITPPTYGMYETVASINDVQVESIPLTPGFELRTDAMRRVWSETLRLVFLCSPNNPTGNDLAVAKVESILRESPGLVVIDEAYVDFATRRSWIERLDEFENLIVLQTCSKAWGLASLRVGMAFASPAIVELLRRIKPPYNVSGMSQELALQVLHDPTPVRDSVRTIVAERQRLAGALAELHCVERVFPSEANFLLVRFRDAMAAHRRLRERGIVVRDRTNLPHCERCLRITIGRPEENQAVLAALSEEAW